MALPRRPALVLRGVFLLLFVSFLTYGYFVAGWLPHDLAGIEARIGALGPDAYLATIVLQAAGTILLVPGFLLVIATAFFFGLDAIWISLSGQTLGAAGAFLIARHVGRDPLRALLGQRLVGFEERLRHRGFAYLVMLRLLNVIPGPFVVYAPGLVSFRMYQVVAAAVVGQIPFVIVLSVFGRSLTDVESFTDLLQARVLIPFFLLMALVGLPVLALWALQGAKAARLATTLRVKAGRRVADAAKGIRAARPGKRAPPRS